MPCDREILTNIFRFVFKEDTDDGSKLSGKSLYSRILQNH